MARHRAVPEQAGAGLDRASLADLPAEDQREVIGSAKLEVIPQELQGDASRSQAGRDPIMGIDPNAQGEGQVRTNAEEGVAKVAVAQVEVISCNFSMAIMAAPPRSTVEPLSRMVAFARLLTTRG